MCARVYTEYVDRNLYTLRYFNMIAVPRLLSSVAMPLDMLATKPDMRIQS